jgi:hypothetical protein
MTDAPSEQALAIAQAIETILKPGPASETPAAPAAQPAPAPAIPAAPGVPPAVVAATPDPGQLPEGIMPLEELERLEREGYSEAGMSHAERVKANERFCASAEYHIKNGSI